MKKLRLIILISMLSGVLMSCSTTRQSTKAYSYQSQMEQSSSDLLLASSAGEYSNIGAVEQKILYSAYLSLTVKAPDTANVYIEKIAKKYDGYIHEIGTNRTVIRVKGENLKDTINEISELGKVVKKSMWGQDATERYLDYKIQLENTEKSKEKYLELLSKAENVEAALKVEKELERINENIDLIKGKINRIDHLSEYSTITIKLKEKKKPGIIGYVFVGLYRSVKWLFVRN